MTQRTRRGPTRVQGALGREGRGARMFWGVGGRASALGVSRLMRWSLARCCCGGGSGVGDCWEMRLDRL